jgi:DsbC/DsbD-like thiol-disulfide interchange protein
MPTRRPLLLAATILVATIVAGINLAAAADASAWDGDARSGIRLIGGAETTDGGSRLLRAGLEIRLSPGWKTYWRYPGDSGVPPNFDFGKSENVKSVNVLWPAPQRLADSEGVTIGYKTGVVFPLKVVPQDPDKPVILRARSCASRRRDRPSFSSNPAAPSRPPLPPPRRRCRSHARSAPTPRSP